MSRDRTIRPFTCTPVSRMKVLPERAGPTCFADVTLLGLTRPVRASVFGVAIDH